MSTEKRRGFWTRVRDSITGRFVKASEAVERPDTTVTETVKDCTEQCSIMEEEQREP